jgi:hypothetical protein
LIDGLYCVQTKERETAGEGEGDGVLRGDDEELDLLRNKIGERVREARQGKIERIEERRRTGAHRRRRNRPGKPADVRGYGEGFRRPRCSSIGEAKGERKRMPRAIYTHRDALIMAGSEGD